ncbi:hypothetical protein [Hymenobacter sp. PAMC 26628]|uniref:hypothetical protein n=1 Tax=Hymenobacter sp. PAMC 26628 TaxID=1484118 RepID=UPI0007705CC3|nr:hypothetical protein [Hymenobacter sp. PAMC 26628]AMJ65013.1 hypothetical protein AXW84_05930 [Hymenobacter sp. PAMC 26628]
MKKLLPLLALLAGCGGTPPPVATTVPAPSEPAELAHLPNHAVFDVPALRHKSLNQIRAKLGVPNEDDSQPTAEQRRDLREWDNAYKKEGMQLRISYNPRNNKVKDFFISPLDGVTNDLNALLAAGHLTPTTPGFEIQPVFLHLNPSTHQYTGVTLVPN